MEQKNQQMRPKAQKQWTNCPECKTLLDKKEGCVLCPKCGWGLCS